MHDSPPSSSVNAESVTQSQPVLVDGFLESEPVEICVRQLPKKNIHTWLFGEALRLRGLGCPYELVVDLFTQAANTFWVVRDNRAGDFTTEYLSAARGAFNAPLVPEDGGEQKPFDFDPVLGAWPEGIAAAPGSKDIDHDYIAEFIEPSEVKTVDDFKRVQEGPLPEDPIHRLFKPDDILCIGKLSDAPRHVRLGDVSPAFISQYGLIVPSPIINPNNARTATGRLSKRCRQSVGPRKYIIIEGDALGRDVQAAILWSARNTLPLVAVTTTAKKSLHGWFLCEGVPGDALAEWYKTMRSLGADPITWRPEQFIRIPGGTRYNDRKKDEPLTVFGRQELLYFKQP